MAKKADNRLQKPWWRRHVRGLSGIALVLVLGGLVLCFRADWQERWFRWVSTWAQAEAVQQAIPDAGRWQLLCDNLEQWRQHDAARYREAQIPAERQAVIREARATLEHSLVAMMRCWLGTPWAYEGMAARPGEGEIACGYFVTTVLQGAGFRLERNALAQQAAQNILLSFLPQQELRLRVGVPYKTFRRETMRGAPGIYLVGLDTHIGFVIVQDQDYRFVHSSGSHPWRVVEEHSAAASVLERSQYRVLGHLTANDDVIRRWLLGEKFATVTSRAD